MRGKQSRAPCNLRNNKRQQNAWANVSTWRLEEGGKEKRKLFFSSFKLSLSSLLLLFQPWNCFANEGWQPLSIKIYLIFLYSAFTGRLSPTLAEGWCGGSPPLVFRHSRNVIMLPREKHPKVYTTKGNKLSMKLLAIDVFNANVNFINRAFFVSVSNQLSSRFFFHRKKRKLCLSLTASFWLCFLLPSASCLKFQRFDNRISGSCFLFLPPSSVMF